MPMRRRVNRKQAAQQSLMTALKILPVPGTNEVAALKEVVDAWRSPRGETDESVQYLVTRTVQEFVGQISDLERTEPELPGDPISLVRAHVTTYVTQEMTLTYAEIEEHDFDARLAFKTYEPHARAYLQERIWLDDRATEFGLKLLRLFLKQIIWIVRTSPRVNQEMTLRTYLASRDAAKNFADATQKIFVAQVRHGTLRESELFEAAYLEALVEHFGESRLLGLDGVSSALSTVPLDVTYISLLGRTVSTVSTTSKTRPASTLGGRRPEGDLRVESTIGQLLSSLNRGNGLRLTIEGVAGSGKTTLSHWLATRCAVSRRHADGLPEELAALRGAMPFVVPLRHAFKEGQSLPTQTALLGDLVVGEPMPGDWVSAQLDSGRAIAILDGLDEVPPSQTSRAREWIAGFCRANPRTHVIVTGRPESTNKEFLSRHQFALLRLAELQSWQAKHLIDRWFNAQCRHAPSHSLRHYRLQQARLNDALARDHSVADLAQTPLLASILCVYYVHNSEERPSARLKLIQGVCYTLLYGRDAAKGLIPTHLAQFGYELRLSALGQVALAMFVEGVSEVENSPEPSAAAQLRINGRPVEISVANPALDVHQCVRHLLDRSAIFMKPTPHSAGFVHRLFLEYIAASKLVNSGEDERLLGLAHQPGWYSVVSFYAAESPDYQTAILIQDLVENEARWPSRRRTIYLLLNCLASLATSEPALYEKVTDLIRGELPPEHEDEVSILAAMGPQVLRILPEPTTTEERLAYIATCAKIRGVEAMDLITHLASQATSDRKIVAAAVQAWRSFPAEDFASTVLQHLDCSRVPVLVPNAEAAGSLHLINAVDIRLAACEGLSDLAWISGASSIKTLDLTEATSIDDLSGIEVLEDTLEFLALPASGAVLVDERVADLRKLRTLVLPDASQSKSLLAFHGSPIKRLSIHAGQASLLEDLEKFSNSLTVLDIGNSNRFEGALCSSLVGLRTLRLLDVGVGGQLDLSLHHQLRSLELAVRNAAHVRLPWRGALRSVSIRNLGMQRLDVHNLHSLPQLELLRLWGGGLHAAYSTEMGPKVAASLEFFQTSKYLRELTLQDMRQFESAYGIELFHHLETLDISGTRVKSLSGAAGSVQVRTEWRMTDAGVRDQMVPSDLDDSSSAERWSISSCENLQELVLDRCSELISAEGIGECSRLKRVSLLGIMDEQLVDNIKFAVGTGVEVDYSYELFLQESG